MSAPKKKRTIAGGESGKDVQGVQRGLWKALGPDSHNARNGNAGDWTIHDLKEFQRRNGIEASGSMGQPTLDALWRHVDAYGRALYFRAKIGKPSPLPDGALRYGAKGDRVRAAQQMLWRALGDEAQNARNATYGEGLAADVRHFHGIIDAAPTDGRTINENVWAMIWAFGDEYAHELAGSAGAGGSSADLRSNLVTWAEWYVATGGWYLQARPYQRDAPPVEPLENDCSGSIHHLFKLAGLPDPSGNDFNGTGYTGSMVDAGRKVAMPKSGSAGLLAGDLIFYGGSPGYDTTHVATMLDGGRLYTFGSNPPTITTYAGYWTSGRRYDVGARRVLA